MKLREFKINKYLSTSLKVIVAIAGLYIAFKDFPLSSLHTLSITKLSITIAIALLLNLINVYISSQRINLFNNQKFTIKELFKINLIGTFFNVFLPSTIGGDTVRAYKLSQKAKDSLEKTYSFLQIVLDRIIGITALFSIGACSYMVGLRDIPAEVKNIFAGIFLILLVVLISFWILILFVPYRYYELIAKLDIKGLRESLILARELLKKKFLKIFILATIMHLISALGNLLLLYGLNIEISFVYVVLVYSLTSIVLMFPVSIGGLGVRDVLIKTFYSPATNSGSVVLSGSLAFFVIAIMGSMGAIAFIADTSRTKKKKSRV